MLRGRATRPARPWVPRLATQPARPSVLRVFALLVKRPVMLLVTELELRLALPPSAFWSSVPRWRVPLRARWGSAPCP